MIDVAIVGAGLAGLSCAVRLEAAGLSVLLLEAADAPGGRIRTDVVDGFRLDRGFQILLTDYPDAKEFLDYKALRLRGFTRGALVRQGGKFHHFADPFRDSLGAALGLVFDPVITMGDKLRVAKLRTHVGRGTVPELFTRDESTTEEFLKEFGFSPRIIERFFRPFFSGIFLERELATSSRFFEFLFRMFAFGGTAVPEQGMEMIPRQLAVRLRADTLLTHTLVKRISREQAGFRVENANGNRIEARALVVAVPGPQARELLAGLQIPLRSDEAEHSWTHTTTLYYAAPKSPVEGPILVLNGDGPSAGPVNNLAVMSQVSERYAPPGAHLVAASIVGEAPRDAAGMERLEVDARAQLRQWFGADVAKWTVVGGYPIHQALPLCRHTTWEGSAPEVADGVYLCGDYRDTPSTQGALASGRRAAAAVLRYLR